MTRQAQGLLAAVLILAMAAAAARLRAEPSETAPAALPAALRLAPPKPPAHAQRDLNSASVLSRDLHEVVVYLEQGKAYFAAYQKENHTPEENALFLEFLEAFEKERAIAKKEADALRRWVHEKSALE